MKLHLVQKRYFYHAFGNYHNFLYRILGLGYKKILALSLSIKLNRLIHKMILRPAIMMDGSNFFVSLFIFLKPSSSTFYNFLFILEEILIDSPLVFGAVSIFVSSVKKIFFPSNFFLQIPFQLFFDKNSIFFLNIFI